MPPLSIVRIAAPLVFCFLFIQPAPAQTEESLEAEFQVQRDRLRSVPEYAGADAESKFRLAEELGRRGDMKGAIEIYREVIRLKPDWAQPYRGLGQVSLDSHDYDAAVLAFRDSIKLGGDDHQAWYWLGRALMGSGNLPEAERALNQAIDRKPDDAEAFADLGLVLMAQGKAAGAEDALTRSIELKPDNADSHRLREQLRKTRGDPDRTKQIGLQHLQDLFARE